MWLAEKPDISQGKMDVECHLPKMFKVAKAIIKEGACIKFYHETKPLYLETCIWGCFRSSPTTNQRQHNLSHRWIARQQHPQAHCICQQEPHWDREVKQQHWAMEVSIIMDHKPHITIFKKDVGTLSQGLQQILLRIHQYRLRILHKPSPDLFMAQLAVLAKSQGI